MADFGKVHPATNKTKTDWPIILYDQSIHKTAQKTLLRAARASDGKKAKEKWDAFYEQIKSERLSDEQIKVLINSLDSHKQWAPLHYAVEANNTYVFHQLTNGDKVYRCDINLNGGNGENVLHIAAQSRKIWEKKDRNPLANTTEAGVTAIMHSVEILCQSDLPWIVHRMLSLGADINDRDDEGRTPLHLAVQSNRYNYAKELIARGADIMATSKFQASVLFFALLPNRATNKELEDMIKLILDHAEKIGHKRTLIQLATLDNETSLARALCHPEVTADIIKLLLMDDQSVDEKQALVAFDTAARYGSNISKNSVCLNPLKSWLKFPTIMKQLPHIFCRHNKASLLEWLEENYNPVNQSNEERICIYTRADSAGYTPLLTAVFYEARECVELIFARLEDKYPQGLLSTNDDHENILHICGKRNVNEDLFGYIWEKLPEIYHYKGELVTMTDIDGNTPLQVAARFDNKDMCKRLLEDFQEVHFKTEAALEASRIGHLDILRSVFKYDTGTNRSSLPVHTAQQILKTRNKDSYTCLHLAAEQGHEEIVDFLINKLNTDVDVIGQRRRTALHVACEKGHLEIVRLLLKAGASTTLRNAQVYNCLDIAIVHQRKTVVQELLRHSTWREMMRNAQPIDGTEAFDTPMRKLIRYTPDVAIWLIDNKLTRTIGGPGQKIYTTIYDYEFYEDMFKVKSWYTQNEALTLEPPTCVSLWRTRGIEAIHTCWCCCHPNYLECSCCCQARKTDEEQWYTNDAYTLVRNHPLFIVSQQSHCPAIVEHFYHTHLRQTKLRSFGLLFFILSYFLYMAYLGLYTSAILMGKHPKYFYDQAQVNLTLDLSTCEYVSNYVSNHSNLASEGLKTETYKRIKWTLYVVLSVFIAKNLINIAVLFPKVFRVGGSYIEIFSLLLSYLYILDWFNWQNDVILRCPVQYQLGAMGLLLSYLNLLLYVRTSPVFDIGIYIVMLQVISAKFLRFLPVFLIIICGFGFTYWMLLQYQDVYSTPIEALLRTGLMLFDLGYESRLYDSEHGGVGYYKLVYVIFALTAIACSIFVINLLIGLAVGEIPTLLTQGTLWRVQILFNLLSDYEMMRLRFILVFDCLTCNNFRRHRRRISCFRPQPYYILLKDELKSPMGAIGSLWNYTQKHFFKQRIQDNIKQVVKSIDGKD